MKCDRWCHTNSTGIDSKVHEVTKTLDNVHWFCDGCNDRVMKLIADIRCLTGRRVGEGHEEIGEWDQKGDGRDCR